MKKKYFKVYFVRPSIGKEGSPLRDVIQSLSDDHGRHLPIAGIQNDKYQIRDLERVGRVWKGAFAKLRDEAPHIVSADNTESAIPLGEDDHILEKCFFLYREESNVLIWQYHKSAGGLSRAADYLSKAAGEMITLPYVQDIDKLEDALRKPIYEIEFDYARPPGEQPSAGPPVWDQAQFDAMAHLERVIDSPAATGRRRRSRVLELPDGQKAVPERHQHRRVELRGALPDVDRRRGPAAALPAARDVQRAALVGPRWRTLAAAAQ